MRLARGIAAAACLCAPTLSAAPAEFLPYRALYPGLYLDAAIESDPGDERFDADGRRRDGALRAPDGPSELPSRDVDLRLAWTFPLFEQEQLPFLSGRLHTARLSLRYRDLDARGAIGDFIDAGSDLRASSGGFGDLALEFGSYLSGSARWREGGVGPLSTLLLFGINLPVGVYEREAPSNAGSNQLSAQLRLGVHGSPWCGAFLDAGLGWRVYGRNEEPAFGALEPSQVGDEALWELRLAQRLRPGLYVALGAQGTEGESNTYRDPRFTTQSFTAPPPGADVVPVAGAYHDDGRALRVAQLGLHWFATQRVVAALTWSHPFSGESGQFDLPLQQRSPAGCVAGALGCVATPAGSVRQDGFGVARALASDRIGLSLTWQFGLGEPAACAGCRD